MDKQISKPSKRGFYASLAGTIAIALCCFTPILVITFGGLGLSSLTPYLDQVLFPALVVLIVITAVSYKRWQALQTKV